jgi:hypothetical protein
MAFLDNSGDIILDAVLTDAGRKRLAKADGTFKIAKFALGDDEIDYSLYDKTNSSGSAYYDLSLLQTPVLEAFTNNTSILKSRLISIPQTNLLYLPIVKLNNTTGVNGVALSSTTNNVDAGGLIYVTADQNTEATNTSTGQPNNTAIKSTSSPFSNSTKDTFLFGLNTDQNKSVIRLDQGLDTTAIPPTQTLDSSLIENQYIIEIDNRLGSIVTPEDKKTKAAISFIDDDNIASYYFSLANDTQYIKSNSDTSTGNATQIIAGPRGTSLQFLVAASLDLQQSTYLFELLGGTQSYTNNAGTTSTYYYIDTIIRVTGAQTGASIDLPIRFLKYKSTP